MDDPFTLQELQEAVSGMKKNKSFCGICPGVIKLLPISWFMFFLTIFNFVFIQISYPVLWCYSKLFVLFKSGNRLLCNNYRGISIMDSLAKIYDILILNRLQLWCNIDPSQAGAQRKRGCLEQIIALRLLCNYALFK